MAKNTLLINVDIGETRVGLISDGVLRELYVERRHHRSPIGNIYLGKVQNVLPAMEAAFVDIGLRRDAFLYVREAGGILEDFSDLFATDLPAAIEHLRKTGIAKAEKKYGGDADVRKMEDIFYNIMTELKFLPNSPTLMNAGRRLGQLAACFVLPVEDSMEGIFDALRNAAALIFFHFPACKWLCAHKAASAKAPEEATRRRARRYWFWRIWIRITRPLLHGRYRIIQTLHIRLLLTS